MAVTPPIISLPTGRGFNAYNLTSSELAKMYPSKIQDDYMPLVTLLYGDSAGKDVALDFLEKFCADTAVTMPTFSDAVPCMFDIVMYPAPDELWTLICTHLGPFVTCGVYVQCSLVHKKHVLNQPVLLGATYGTTWYDAACHFTRSVDPITHPMIAFDEEYPGDPNPSILEQKYRDAIGDIFRDGSALFCKGFEPIRVEILVKMRAKMSGVDPEFEFKQFCVTGISKFLETLP